MDSWWEKLVKKADEGGWRESLMRKNDKGGWWEAWWGRLIREAAEGGCWGRLTKKTSNVDPLYTKYIDVWKIVSRFFKFLTALLKETQISPYLDHEFIASFIFGLIFNCNQWLPQLRSRSWLRFSFLSGDTDHNNLCHWFIRFICRRLIESKILIKSAQMFLWP